MKNNWPLLLFGLSGDLLKVQIAYHASQIFCAAAIFRFFHKFPMFKGLKVRTCHTQADAVHMHTMLLFSGSRHATEMSSPTMHPQHSASATGTDAHRHAVQKALEIESFATMSTESCPVGSGFEVRMGRCFPAGDASMIRSRLAAARPRQVLRHALQRGDRDRPAERCRRRHNRVHSAQAAGMARPTTAAWWRIVLPAGPWSRQTYPWGRNRTGGRPGNNRWPCRWPAKSPVPCHTEPGAWSW